VATPDAGSSKKVSSNRGYVFIPEIGDRVMVGFEYGDPNRPYVMSGIFSEKIGVGGGEENHIKSVTTRVGSTVTFDDTAHTILVCTSSNNMIFIEEKPGHITINSVEEVNVNTQNINVNALENMNVTIGKNLNMSVGGNTTTSIKGNSLLNVNGNTKTEISGNESRFTKGQTDIEVVKNLNIESNGETKIESDGQMIVESESNTYIKSKVNVQIAKG
jgi:uncharacterized protein involved in type VI secretion and phage assembly